MINVHVSRTINHAPAVAWALLADYGNMSWTGAPKFEVEGEGPGMIRRVIMDGLDPIEEVLEWRPATA